MFGGEFSVNESQCLVSYVSLYIGIVMVLFCRAVIRRKLLKDCREFLGCKDSIDNEHFVLRLLHKLPRQHKSLKELGRVISKSPSQVQVRFTFFNVLTVAAIFLCAILAFLVLFASKVCTP